MKQEPPQWFKNLQAKLEAHNEKVKAFDAHAFGMKIEAKQDKLIEAGGGCLIPLAGLVMATVGMTLCLTIIGIPFGLPLIILGLLIMGQKIKSGIVIPVMPEPKTKTDD